MIHQSYVEVYGKNPHSTRFNSQLDSDISMEVVLLETQPKQQEIENRRIYRQFRNVMLANTEKFTFTSRFIINMTIFTFSI